MGRVVLVTGVSRPLGMRMAQILSGEDVSVLGVDVVSPSSPIDGVDFIRADIRNPVIAKVIDSHQVDTVVHMGVLATPMQAGGRSKMKEINVIGTMQLLAACQRSSTLRRLVVKSSSSVYGAGPKDPAMFTEDMAPKHPPSSGWAKDSVEVENYVRGFARKRSDIVVTTLRFANFIGPDIGTAMASYYQLPVVPTVLGHDARLQFIHVDDGLEVMRQSVMSDHQGTFNVAGDGIVMLSQSIRLVGRPNMPLPTFALGAVRRGLMAANVADFSPEQIRFLTYGRGMDTTRLKNVFGYSPRYSSIDAFMDFADSISRGAVPAPHQLAEAEEGVISLMRRGEGMIGHG